MWDIYFKTRRSKKLDKIKRIREGVWINIKKANTEDLEKVAELTGLDLPDLDDILDPHELPRIERHGKAVIIFLRNPNGRREKSEFIYTRPVTIIITDKYFFTISAEESPFIQNILKKNMAIATTQRGKLLVYLSLKISKNFTRHIKDVRNDVASRQKDISNIKGADIQKLIKNEDVLNQYISGLIPMRNVFETIVSGNYFYLYEEDEDLLQDMIISIRQSVDLGQVNIKSIQALRESYQIMFTNKLNKTIQFLTSFTIIMTVPTIIASIYGMNVKLPLENSPIAFEFVIFISVLIMALFLLVFHKKKWL